MKIKKRGYTNSFMKNRRGQIWIETVIYTLIAFVLIGAVLAFAKPKIEEIQDKAVLDQTLELFEGIDSAIFEVAAGGQGNQRRINVGLKKGELRIDGEADEIVFEMESRHEYSEPGKEIQAGNLDVNTTKKGKYNLVKLTNDYNGDYNIKYEGEDYSKTLTKTATLYVVLVSNDGRDKLPGTGSCIGVGDSDSCDDPLDPEFEKRCAEITTDYFECFWIAPKTTINFEVVS